MINHLRGEFKKRFAPLKQNITETNDGQNL